MSRAGTEQLTRHRRTKAEMAALRAFEAAQDAGRMASQAEALEDVKAEIFNTPVKFDDEFFDVAGANVDGFSSYGKPANHSDGSYMLSDSSPARFGRVAFMHSMNELLKRIEKEAPHKAARELENRIADGEARIKAASARGKITGDQLSEAFGRLDGLKADLVRLHREYTVPHYVFQMIHSLLDLNDREVWPLTSKGSISVNLPGIVAMAVEISPELPF